MNVEIIFCFLINFIIAFVKNFLEEKNVTNVIYEGKTCLQSNGSEHTVIIVIIFIHSFIHRPS